MQEQSLRRSSTVVYICNGYTVNVAANNAASSNLTIEPGATLDVQTYTGHTLVRLSIIQQPAAEPYELQVPRSPAEIGADSLEPMAAQ